MIGIFIIKRGTSADWEKHNPVIPLFQLVREIETGRFKVGDGKSRYMELPFSNTLP
jgi:hypothetical protein